MIHEVRCGACDYWLGESAEPLVYIETIKSREESRVRPRRDTRLCKKCGQVSVFIPLDDLDSLLKQRVG